MTSLLVAKPDDLGRFVVISGAAHAFALLVFLGYQLIAGPPAIDLSSQPIKATLIRRGVKRDEKLLPRKDESPPPPAEKAPSYTTKQDLFKAFEKATKAPGAKDSSKNQLFDSLNKVAKTAEVQGDPNGDENGDSATQEGERYFGELTARIKRNYDVSSTIPDSERIRLVAWVGFRIDRTGHLIGKAELMKSSKNELFDTAVLAAVTKAAPFPVPPDHLRDLMASQGVQLNFRP